ncbi:ribonuclease H-like domain-containing protein [Tanacetum coccineum]|uniref:Ribonuclease H-like domain-containing protein n=1 Tax=Tanacetum coccineum TaxID=301880 RepID=A0ABQ5AGD0_9ASTR
MIKDSKYFVGFDESKCYIQDLKLGKIVGTSSESGGLYMFDCDHNGKTFAGMSNSGIVSYVSKELWHIRLGHPVDQFEIKVKVIRSDNGTEFVNNKMSDLFTSLGIIHQTSCSYTPQQNGIAERKHRHMLPSSVLSGASPFKIVYGKEPSLSYLRDFSPNDEEGDSSTEDGGAGAAPIQNEGVVPLATQIEDNVTSEGNKVRRSSRPKSQPIRFNDYVVSSNVKYGLEKFVCYSKLSSVNYCFSTVLNKSVEPKSYIEACNDENWINAMNLEMEALHRNVRCLIGLAISKNWSLFQLDVNNAFFYGDLDEEVYMALPLERFHLEKYCLELLSEYGLLACKPAATPLQQNNVLSFEETKNDKFLPSTTEYQKLVGKLIYLSVTRPDIAYDVHCLSQHMHAPLQSHFSVGLRVLRFLKQAPSTGVQFNKGNEFRLHAFSDADWAKCLKTRKSVSGFYVYFCNNLVSWKSKKQATISRSSAESEYRCLTSTTCEVIWIAKILKDLDIEGLFPVDLYCDSSAAIQIAANPIGSANNVADVLTKELSVTQHVEFCKKLGLVDMFKP